MADNVELDAGSGGPDVATDDIGGVQYPRSKIVLGADGTNDGDVCKTNGLPVSGNTAADGGGTETRILVDAAGNPQVDVLSSALPSGAATSAKQDTEIASLASMDTKLTTLAGYLDGVETALAALALESGGNLAAAAGGIGTANDAIATQASTGSISAKLRLVTSQLNTLAGYLDGVEGLLGSVALETGGNLEAAAGGIGTAADAVAVQGSTGSVSAKLRLVTSQLNTLLGYTDGLETALSGLALETGGNLAAAASGIGATGDAAATQGSTGSISAKLRTITAQLNTQAGYLDGVETLLAAATPAGTNMIGDVNARRETGTVYEATVALTVKRAKISAASSGENTIVAAVSTKKIRVLSMALVGVGTAVSIYFKDAASGNGVFADSTNPIPIDKTGAAGAGGLVLGHNLDGWFQTAESGALILNLSTAQAVAGCISYAEVE